MAKVTFINAIVQGKLGGGVYSRNRGGYYLKSFSQPLNPSTQAQQAARQNFGAAATAWHSLTDSLKAQWNSYASTHFRAKSGASVSVSTGFQAFVSLYNSALNANRTSRAATIVLPVGLTATVDEFTFSTTPPSQEFSSMIQDSTGAPLPLLAVQATLSLTNEAVSMMFAFPHSQASEPNFVDAVGSVPCGIQFQMSTAMTQSNQFVANPRNITIGTIKPITGIATWSATEFLTFACAGADFDITKYKSFASAGDVVQISAYLVGESGQQAYLGGVKCTVAA